MIALIVALVATAPADIDTRQRARIDLAADAIKRGKPQSAIDTLDPAIAAYETAYKDEQRQIYCGMSSAQSLAYMVLAAAAADKGNGPKSGAIAVGPAYCEALYLKGYALVDLDRLTEARHFYDRAIALAPMHAHFLTEMGQTFRYEKNWPAMLDWCRRGEGMAELADKASVKDEQGLALRCQGYALVELARWDEAEAIYRKCLKIDPGDEKARGELGYVRQNRPKPDS